MPLAMNLPTFRFTGSGTSITQYKPLSSLTGIIYAKPNVTTNPPTCLFYKEQTAAPYTNLQYIYTQAASALNGGTPTDHSQWPTGQTQTNLDLNFKQFGFDQADTVAIAINIDDSVNGGTGYDYSFASQVDGSNYPSMAVQADPNTASLYLIQGDNTNLGTVNGPAGPHERKTVVFVCPGAAVGPLIPFNMNILTVSTVSSSNQMSITFDPKIKNDG